MLQEFDEQMLDEYLALIDKKIDAAGGRDWPLSERPHPLSSLTDAEQITLAAHFFALDVSNGGFEKYFLERGDTWRETRHAIRTLGATCVAGLFEVALGTFPGNVPSSDPILRYHQLVMAGALGDEGLFWRLTTEYYKLQETFPEHCLYQRLAEFASKQLEMLKGT